LKRFASISVIELIRACAEPGDTEAWEEFVSRFHRSISLSVLRTTYMWGKPPEQVVDDLVQEAYLKLCADKCRLLLDFSIQHPEGVMGYIKKIAINVVHDHFKALHSQKRGAGEVCQFLEEADPKAEANLPGGQTAIERGVLLKEINQCLRAYSGGPDQERDCLIFWLYYQQGMSAKAIASLPTIGLSAKGVESAIFRLTRLVREHLVGLPGEKGFLPAESY
jgi:RNA polymerase sigma-70 factor, ECF subfamily